jgi:nucleotide-binding universal stress UspA family protein
MEIQKILFPTDFSRCAEQALAHALYLAKQYQAELHVLHAVILHGYNNSSPELDSINIDEIHRQMAEVAATRMRSMLDTQTLEHIKISVAQHRGISPGPVILDYALDHEIDLIVMGTQGRRGLGHVVIGSVAEEIVRRARCPVLTIRQRKEPQPIEDLDRILVPVDFSEHSRQALRYAKQIAASYDSRLGLLHVIEQSVQPSFYAVGPSWMADALVELKRKAHNELQRLFEETPGPLTSASFHVTEGRAATDIVTFARDNKSDLIVIATHGLTGIEHLLLGSITEKVVRRAPCPVFTVKAFGRNLLTGSNN